VAGPGPPAGAAGARAGAAPASPHLGAGRGFAGYLWRAWRRGRRAGCLPALPWDELLAEPLDAVRRLARIGPPEAAHPEGVRVGDASAR
jgi:hypothetical protein